VPEGETESVNIKFLVMVKKTATKNLQSFASSIWKREQLLRAPSDNDFKGCCKDW
jgi:hypothetical protein